MHEWLVWDFPLLFRLGIVRAALGIDFPGEITGKVLVGFGAFMAGAGAVLSGIAALRSARKEKPKEAKDEPS